jgi:acetyl esterase/lipase
MVRFLLAAGALCLGLAPAPAQAPAEVRTETDVVFGKGGGRELKLDLAMPKDGAGPFPAVVCVHGGGWVGGDRKQMAATIQVLARRGFVAVTPDYRTAPAHRFPAQLEDCKAAVRWLRANAAKYKVNPDRIGAVGFSAGAHLACLLGVTDKGDGLEGTGGNPDVSSRVQAVVSFFGPTDLTAKWWGPTEEKKNLVPLLGGTLSERPEAYRQASPITYAGAGSPPFLFFHGSADMTVPPEQSFDLAAKLRAAGVEARVIPVESEGHGWRGEKLLDSLAQMVLFFNDKLKP